LYARQKLLKHLTHYFQMQSDQLC